MLDGTQEYEGVVRYSFSVLSSCPILAFHRLPVALPIMPLDDVQARYCSSRSDRSSDLVCDVGERQKVAECSRSLGWKDP